MAADQYDLVCIGSGPAGQRAAVQGAKLGKRVTIVENQDFVGGHCIQSGPIPSKSSVTRYNESPPLEGWTVQAATRLGRAPGYDPRWSNSLATATV